MSVEMPVNKIQIVLWWITSIATSVLCCAVLFILFANYLVDVRASVRDNNERINIVQEREDRILAEIELIRKHTVLQATQPTAAVQVPAGATTTTATEPPVSLSVSGTNPDKAPEASSTTVPVTPAAPVSPAKK
jgi:hypothetical protein